MWEEYPSTHVPQCLHYLADLFLTDNVGKRYKNHRDTRFQLKLDCRLANQGIILIQRVLKMVYNAQNYWGSLLCPSWSILKCRKRNISDAGSVSFFRLGAETPPVLGREIDFRIQDDRESPELQWFWRNCPHLCNPEDAFGCSKKFATKMYSEQDRPSSHQNKLLLWDKFQHMTWPHGWLSSFCFEVNVLNS
jgi:hypothetical protein